VDAIEARSLAQTQALQREWEQRLDATVAGLKAEEQTKMYMQEVRIEQLTQRLAAIENGNGSGNAGTIRSTTNGGDAAVSEERVAALITSVELLRGQISDLETQLSVVTSRRNARNGTLGSDGGNLSAEVDRRLRDVERGQQQSFLSMEERLAVQTEAAVERYAHLAV
jgi:polyhydroxyalkanoate synthesis regulator phasin